jgi:hypothetical protein
MSGEGMGAEDSSIVHQAQTLVAEQANCSLARALELLHDTADATGETLDFVAAEVVAGRVTFGGHER